MDVLINPSVILKILNSTGSRKSEVAGYLIGYIQDHSLIVEDIEVPDQVSSPVSVTIESEKMMKTLGNIKKQCAHAIICGWFHSHPGMGADFLSSTDIKTQLTYQKLFPDSIALVIDPVEYSKTLEFDNKTLSLYRLKDDTPVTVDFKTTLTSRDILSITLKTFKPQESKPESLNKAELVAELSHVIKESRKQLLTTILSWNLIIIIIVLMVLSIILL
ncbi:MAG: hypothetical protein QW327_06975 [Candidatus Odinarchaeota archaeon]